MNRKHTEADQLLAEQIDEIRNDWDEEHRFHDDRRWRFDFAIIKEKIAIEIEGGVWTNGAHVRGKHFISDMEKYNHAALLGWRVLRFTPQQVLKGEAIAFIKQILDCFPDPTETHDSALSPIETHDSALSPIRRSGMTNRRKHAFTGTAR